MGNPNIKDAGVKFKPGVSGNPNGRPRKSFGTVNAELQKKGIKPLSKTDLVDAYGLIFNLDEAEINELLKDKGTPVALKGIIAELSNKNTRAKAMQDYRDYMFGKAIQTVASVIKVDDSELSKEQQKTLTDLFKKNGIN